MLKKDRELEQAVKTQRDQRTTLEREYCRKT